MNKIILEDAEKIANSKVVDWDKLIGKSVLIAGANGYVPQFFIHALLKRNDCYDSNIKLYALCRNPEKAKERFGEYFDREDFILLNQDICDEILVDGLDYIIHAASPAGIKVTMDNPMAVFDANVMGMRNLAEIALKNNAKVLYISSVDIYGTIDEIRRYSENDIGRIDHLASRNIYASAKRATESLCMCYGVKGLKYNIVRPSQIMGPGIGMDDERLHINMISQMINKGKITLKGDGTPKRSFIYITDVIIGMLCVLTKAESGEVFNVCNEAAEATVGELAKLISRIFTGQENAIDFDFVARAKDPAVKTVVSQVCISSEKLQKLGYKAEVDLETASRRMISYYAGGRYDGTKTGA